jgi:ATP-binding cassette subfamily B protein RaxB
MLQTEAAECGLACLAMVASARMACTPTWPTLRQRFSLSLKGVTLADLVRMADGLQLQARALRAETGRDAQLQTPCILHWDMNHFVVLVSRASGQATADPRPGARRAPAQAGPASPPLHRRGAGADAGPASRREERRRTMRGASCWAGQRLKRALAQILLLALALEAFVLLNPF